MYMCASLLHVTPNGHGQILETFEKLPLFGVCLVSFCIAGRLLVLWEASDIPKAMQRHVNCTTLFGHLFRELGKSGLRFKWVWGFIFNEYLSNHYSQVLRTYYFIDCSLVDEVFDLTQFRKPKLL